jgi:sugar-phosphatase
MDGVLVDSRVVVERTWHRWAARHGIDPAPLIAVAHGRRTRDTLRLVAPHLALDEEVAWLDAAEAEDFEGIVAIAGAEKLLTALPSGRWAVVTSAGASLARRRLERAGLPLPFTLIASEDVAVGKPAPDGYLIGAERMGVHAARCLVVEDAPAGVAAGRAAGATVLGVTTSHSEHQLAGAALVVPDLRGVRVTHAAGELLLSFADSA